MVQVIRKTDAGLLKKISSFVKTFNALEMQVGWFSTSQYEDGTPVAYVATIHEFGYAKGGIPPRPFMRPTADREENNWRRFVAQEAPKILEGKQTVQALFEILGLNISGSIAQSITEVTEPELKKATVRAKVRKMADGKTVGSLDKPLVESGLMLASVTYTVAGTESEAAKGAREERVKELSE